MSTAPAMGGAALERVRAIVQAWPGVTERQSHGALCFFVSGNRALCYFHDDYRGDGRISLSCRAPAGVQREHVSSDSRRFFAPTASARGAFATWL